MAFDQDVSVRPILYPPTTTANPNPNLSPYSTDSSGATAEYGVNLGPVLYIVTLNSDGVTFHSTPVLMSSIPAKPALSEQEIKDVVAFLKTLTDNYPPTSGPVEPRTLGCGFVTGHQMTMRVN